MVFEEVELVLGQQLVLVWVQVQFLMVLELELVFELLELEVVLFLMELALVLGLGQFVEVLLHTLPVDHLGLEMDAE